MKLSKKWLFLVIPLLLFCLGYFAYRHYVIHNIFDEIYYNQEYSLGKPVLEKIEGVSNPISDNASGGNRDREIYALNSLPSGVNGIEYSFNFSNEYGDSSLFAIIIKQMLADDGTEVTTSYIYHSKTKIVDRILWVKSGSSELTSDKEDITNALEKNKTTYKEFAKKSDAILKTVLLRDWCSVYNSRYSPDDWGDVTVKSKWDS